MAPRHDDPRPRAGETNAAAPPRRWQPRAALRDDLPLFRDVETAPVSAADYRDRVRQAVETFHAEAPTRAARARWRRVPGG